MRIVNIFFVVLFFSVSNSFGQFIIPGEGLMDIKIGSDWDEIEWELGFKGTKVDKERVESSLIRLAEISKVDFDFVVRYQHIMWLPVSDIFFKDDKVCLIQVNSYPEYNQMLCTDIGTVEGLNFWDDEERVTEIYGNLNTIKNDDKSYCVYNKMGLGVEIMDNEVRTMVIFHPQME